MALPARQLVTLPESEAWLPVDQAAALTGESVRTWRRRAEAECKRAVFLRRTPLSMKAPPRGGRGKAIWWVHRSIHRSLRPAGSTTEDAQAAQRESLLVKYPTHAVNAAYVKARWLVAWRQACKASPRESETRVAARIVDQARRVEGNGFAISARSLQVWRRLFDARGKNGAAIGAEGLIDRRACPRRDGAEGTIEARTRSPEAIGYFYALYHTQSRISVAVCHEETRRKAAKEGWTWPASYGATRKWLKATDDLSLTCLMREGREAWCHRFMPSLDIDYSLIEPGDMYQTDHHKLDLWCWYGDTQIRPWLTAVHDLRSRCVVGWHLGPEPHQDAIIAAYLQAFRDWAIPKRLRIDNGRDYASKLLTGVTKATRDRLRSEYGREWADVLKREANLVDCTGDSRFSGITNELGIDTVYAIPYAAWSKGITERWFGTFERRCGVTFATYCGHSALVKPECLDVIRRGYTKDQKRRLRKLHGRDWKKHAILKVVDQSDVPTMADVDRAIGEYVDIYHDTAHTGDAMDGRTPLDVWKTATSLRRADDMSLLFLMQSRGLFKVGPNGVAFTIGGARMKYGAGQPALYPYVGRKVFITLDPNRLDVCYAFTPEREGRRFIGRLEANKRISPDANVDELREAHANVGRRRKVMHQAQREAPARTRTAAEELTASRRERAAALRATGTDHATPHASIVPVATGFESASKKATAARNVAPPVDRKAYDIEAAKRALGYRPLTPKPAKKRPRLDDSVLKLGWAGNGQQASDTTEDDDADKGKDAGKGTTDILRLIAHGNRQHERA